MKRVLITTLILMLAGVGTVRAATITVPLNDPLDINPDPYIVDIPLVEFPEHSEVILEVENVLDPTRYKDWDYQVFIPTGSPAVAELDYVRYYADSEMTILSLELTNVDLDYEGTQDIGGQDYDIYYASTFETKWEDYGTSPVGEPPGPYGTDIGNPAWVAWACTIDDSITGSVYAGAFDVCVPEPATLCLFGMGALAMLRRRRS